MKITYIPSMKIYSIARKVYDVQMHRVSCHKHLKCGCDMVDEPMLVLQPDEVIIIFDEFSYARDAITNGYKDRALFEDTWSFLVHLRGQTCSICLSRSNLKLKEIACSLPIIRSSSGPSP